MKTKHNKLQVSDESANLRKMLKEIATYHKDHNPEGLSPERLRPFNVHSGIRAAVVHCITKEYDRIKAYPPIKSPPPEPNIEYFNQSE